MKRATFLSVVSTFLIAIMGIAFFVAPRAVEAQGQTCQYQSTQARVQPNRNTELTQWLNLKCGESFLVGSFHNGSGQWATDTVIDVTGPNGNYWSNVGNGATIITKSNLSGTYYVNVRTNGQSGNACTAQAYVNTWCPAPTPTPNPGKCEYDSVQARVKLPGISNEWKKELHGLRRGDVFEVGGFYNNSGQLIPDDKAKIVIVDPRGNRTILSENNQGYKTFRPGTYEIRVRVKGVLNESCTDTAYVYVGQQWAR